MHTKGNAISLADAGFSGRLIAMLNCANAYTVDDVKQMTDFRLIF